MEDYTTTTSNKKTILTINTPMSTFMNEFISGSFGGMCGIIVGHPLDTVKVRMQTNNSHNTVYKSIFQSMASIVKNEKPRALFKGMLSPLLGEMLNNCLLFGVYGLL